MDKIKQKLKGAFRPGDDSGDEDIDPTGVLEREFDEEPTCVGIARVTESSNEREGGVSFGGGVAFADEPPPERKERRPRFADMPADDGPSEGGAGIYTIYNTGLYITYIMIKPHIKGFKCAIYVIYALEIIIVCCKQRCCFLFAFP